MGDLSRYAPDEFAREGAPCPDCGGNVRLRGLAHLASLSLYGRSIPVPQWDPRPDKTVLGVSDPFFERFFAQKLCYIATQFDPEVVADSVHLDISNPPREMLGMADVAICSEVLEHVVPPVGAAFDGLFALLKPGGSLIFSVPYMPAGRTKEHFPDLFEWKLVTSGEVRVLQNRTRDGRLQEFSDLVFHGGGRDVLEMRVFSLPDVLEHLTRAGFVDVHVMDENIDNFGIRFAQPWSRFISARRPPQNALEPKR